MHFGLITTAFEVSCKQRWEKTAHLNWWGKKTAHLKNSPLAAHIASQLAARIALAEQRRDGRRVTRCRASAHARCPWRFTACLLDSGGGA